MTVKMLGTTPLSLSPFKCNNKLRLNSSQSLWWVLKVQCCVAFQNQIVALMLFYLQVFNQRLTPFHAFHISVTQCTISAWHSTPVLCLTHQFFHVQPFLRQSHSHLFFTLSSWTASPPFKVKVVLQWYTVEKNSKEVHAKQSDVPFL